MSTVTVRAEIDCASGPCALWDVITNTDHLNRAVGMKPIRLEPLSEGGAARYLVRTRLGGFPVEYEERPYEWVQPERFAVRRRMRRGPARSLEMSFELEPRGEGTRVRLRLTVVPRSALIAPIAHLSGRQTLRRMLRVIRRVDEDLRARRACYLCRPPRVDAAALGQAAAALAQAAPGQGALAERLVGLVREGQDTAVDRLRPFALAAEWGADPDEVLALCLQAVQAGLLDLSWDLVCPSCRTAAGRLPSLRDLGEEGHCQLCEIGFALEMDRAVEATFRPAAAVRQLDAGPYCIGGPAQTPHVVAQLILQPGAEAALPAPAEPGDYRLFLRGGAAAPLLVRTGAAEEVRAVFPATAEGQGPGEPAAPTLSADAVAPGGRVLVTQESAEERHVKLERGGWAEGAATAHRVSMAPAFRRLFAKEALRPGLSLRVGRVALLFSDLTDSTALYSQMGDALAFGLVQDHFTLLGGVIEAEGGVVIKTIGDAVMAAFPDELGALRAALEAQRRFAAFRGAHPHAGAVSLKLGVHAGPCYAVTANGVLDYFGQSVNTAARLQGLAAAGEVVLAADLAERAAAAGLLAGASVTAPVPASLKGLPAPLSVVRVRV